MRVEFAVTPAGRERLSPSMSMPRHRHAQGYVAVVLSGSYVEAGDEGRRCLGPGDALVHHEWDAHLDCIGARGVEILSVPLPAGRSLAPAFRVADPDALARIAEHDPVAAAEMLDSTGECPTPLADWPDLLAAALRSQPDLRIGRWAAGMRLAPAAVSRGFRAAFGTTPARYRAEARARHAWNALVESDAPLAAIAHDCGFADQAHLSRAVAALTGASPTAWRAKSNRFKTAP